MSSARRPLGEVRRPPDPGEWVTLEQAATMVGYSRDGFRELAARKGITTRRRGPLPGVSRAEVEALLAAAKIAPGELRRAAPGWFSTRKQRRA
ncbi:hypothetical protein GHK86_09055 [Acidimicrobiaceae bacterium USS-CC1]|uniref:Helix-turn-helix domain-containing protein n=1 Tax=Acidiferrimicrobium australe TaxID=2664430 RepID=A0ABW9QSR3_9ACTN|nr:hypothetical protein [Acidiferrimicrobium australe]